LSPERPRCAYCGKLLRLWTTTERAPRDGATHIPVRDWEYRGNLRVVARDYDNVLISPDGSMRILDKIEDDPRLYTYRSEQERQGTRERRLDKVHLWDGESYRYKYWPFCTDVCSGKFAEAAYRAGYRMKDK